MSTSNPSSDPDIMNDPRFNPTPKSGRMGSEEADTCRICRGEGTEQEPLFYPCKCSGSIKFVHQDCLMEWLSHSQKKHCELCKTSFRFTKLYDPKMPNSLPATVFLRRAAIHTAKTVLTWCRVILVVGIWLFWLPWCMRFVWWGLFWIADGGWAAELNRFGDGLGQESDFWKLAHGRYHFLNYTLQTQPPPASQNAATSQQISSMLARLGGMLSVNKFVSSLRITINSTSNQLMITSKPNNTVEFDPPATHGSLLSNLEFFKNLTPNQAVNKFITDILEGQIITLLVIVAVILVFLIREWVVQQQPGNLGAAQFMELAHNARGNQDEANQGQEAQNEAEDVAQEATGEDDEAQPPVEGDTSEGRVEDPQRDSPNRTDTFANAPPTMLDYVAAELEGRPLTDDGADSSMDSNAHDAEPSHVRPAMPYRAQSSLATGIRRDLEEGNVPPTNGDDEALANNNAEPQNLSEPSHQSSQDSTEALPTSPEDPDTNAAEQQPSPDAQQPDPPPGEAAGVVATAEQPEEESTNEPEHKSLADRFWEWLWGDIGPGEQQEVADGDVEQIVRDIDEEPPFIPFVEAQPQNFRRADEDAEAEANAQGAEQNEPAGEANQNEREAVDEMEDLEGILELVGMQGPLIALVQNALFCAVLVSATVTTAVWFPYLWGKVVLLFLASPSEMIIRFPLRTISGIANFTIDFSIFFFGSIIQWLTTTVQTIIYPLTLVFPVVNWTTPFKSVSGVSGNVADAAILRIGRLFIPPDGGESPFAGVSLNSHIALRTLERQISQGFYVLWDLLRTALLQVSSAISGADTPLSAMLQTSQLLIQFGTKITQFLYWTCLALPDVFRHYFVVQGRANEGLSTSPSDHDMTFWTNSDRALTVTAGYAFFVVLGAAYLQRGSPFSTSQQGKKIEAIIAEVLQQAGGIIKVILIISIEMIAFPFYCGVLLDLALLPLFPPETNSIQSRVVFASSSPWTAAFVHWFLGTCYMFHFALFVSMCRKAMRSGVLYFIRDPDDPTFHPVRDVLERNVSSQLRKIGFSALVYGALVILCMGSVVWAVAHFAAGILPIRWSSRSSVQEFPADLLLYNFLTPVVMHLFKPSKGLHVVYNWWLRKCARALRLSDFLFGERHADEEGRAGTDNETPSSGTFVRAPGSDQVRIPKGHKVFLEVDQDNNRIDALPDLPDGVHGKDNKNFTKVYVPPFFRLRIVLFVVGLWSLTVALGLGATLGPLLAGRWLASLVVTDSAKVSDVYAFSAGILIFGGIIYSAATYKEAMKRITTALAIDAETFAAAYRIVEASADRALRVIYTYSAFAFLIPTVFALLLEFYVIMPLHAYLASSVAEGQVEKTTTASEPKVPTSVPPHTIFFLQDWTLGLLYARIALRVLLWSAESRPARALRAVVARGWTNPNAWLATRCFIAPVAAISATALLVPAGLGEVAARVLFQDQTEDGAVQLRRLAYPAVLAFGILLWLAMLLARAIGLWRNTIRDEVYLIGERLHNFGEKQPPREKRRANDSRFRQLGNDRGLVEL